jgi:hypothetical protein
MTALDLALVPLDSARRGAFRVATRSPWLTRALGRKDSRLAIFATAQVAVAFALTLIAPVAVFAVAPVLLGVLHVGADVRYLVLRQKLPVPLLVVSGCAASALFVVRLLATFHFRAAPADVQTWELAIGTAWIGASLLLALGPRTPAPQAIGALAVFAALVSLGLGHLRTAYLLFFHAHNLVAVVVWLVLFRKRRAWAVAPLVALVLFTAFLLSGAPVPWMAAHGTDAAFGLRLTGLATWLAPGLSAPLGASVVLTYVFLQEVHYAAWVGWVPQESLPGEGTFTFRMTARSLARDFGKLGLALVIFAALAVAVYAVFRLHEARNTYMALSNFHGWLECALFVFFFVGRAGEPAAFAKPSGANVT